MATERSSQIWNVLGEELPELALRPDADSEGKKGIKDDSFFFWHLLEDIYFISDPAIN